MNSLYGVYNYCDIMFFSMALFLAMSDVIYYFNPGCYCYRFSGWLEPEEEVTECRM